MSVARAPFGTMADGRMVERFTLSGQGMAVSVITYGAALQALHVPDRAGQMADVVLGCADLPAYQAQTHYFGAVVGRYANRIANGTFTIGGRIITLPRNDGRNCLHGGPEGFDRQVWTVREIGDGALPFVELGLDMSEEADGFPGAIEAIARYTLSAPGELTLELQASVSQTCPVNLTGHAYFNLAGVEAPGDIRTHELRIPSGDYLPVNADTIPLGAPAPVAGTPFDFREGTPIGDAMRADDAQIALAGGYDHNYCFAETGAEQLLAHLGDPVSGRALRVYSDKPGLQFYSGQMLDGTAGKHGVAYGRFAGLCLEPQAWPDSPNHDTYPDVALPPGGRYRHRIRYAFGIE